MWPGTAAEYTCSQQLDRDVPKQYDRDHWEDDTDGGLCECDSLHGPRSTCAGDRLSQGTLVGTRIMW